jgi:hypothetical protein
VLGGCFIAAASPYDVPLRILARERVSAGDSSSRRVRASYAASSGVEGE